MSGWRVHLCDPLERDGGCETINYLQSPSVKIERVLSVIVMMFSIGQRGGVGVMIIIMIIVMIIMMIIMKVQPFFLVVMIMHRILT